MYVSQRLLKENWSAGNFLQILGFCFYFLPQLYSDWSFMAKLLL
jgi:hypothetical protein